MSNEISQLREQMQAQRQMLEDALKELRRQNQDLAKALEKVQKRNAELAEIAYQTSHDMRGPIATLQGLANLMSLENDPDLTQEFINEVPHLLQKIDVFAKSLSDYSNLVNSPTEYQTINWEQLIQRATISFNRQDALQISIHEEKEQEFFSDPARIETILRHLIGNAFHFNQDLEDDLRIFIKVRVTAAEAVVQVIDNGSGIEEDRLKKVFNMFYRGSLASKGSGVGLYLVKTIVEDLQGKVNVENNESGSGVCFKIKIPQAQKPVKLPSFDF